MRGDPVRDPVLPTAQLIVPVREHEMERRDHSKKSHRERRNRHDRLPDRR
jgi:hypothetical protein